MKTDNLKRYVSVGGWNKPHDQDCLYLHLHLDFSGMCPNGKREDFHAISTAVISKEEQDSPFNHEDGLRLCKEVKKENALLVLLDLIYLSLADGCLLHPKARAYKDHDGSWGISPWRARKINAYWEQMAKKHTDKGYWIPVQHVMVYDASKSVEVPLT